MKFKTVKLKATLGTLVAASILLTGCSSGTNGDPGSAPTSDTETSTVPVEMVYAGAASVPGSTQIGLWAVPDKLGFFEEEGLEVTQELADGSTAAIQVVASGSADYTNAGVVSVMAAVNTGVPVKAFAGVVQNYPWRMATLADSPNTSPTDLDGKTIGIISLASESNVFARAWVSENGMDVGNITFVPVGAGSPALAALESGEIDAIALYTEMYAALENTGAEFSFFESPALFDQMPSIALTAPVSAIESNGDVFERMARAAFKGLLFAWANPEAATQIGYEYYPEKKPEDSNFEEALANDTRTFQAWIDSVMPGINDGENPLEWGDFGEIERQVLEDVQSFALSADQLEQEVPIDDVWTDELIDGINDFDRQEVLDLAKNWTP